MAKGRRVTFSRKVRGIAKRLEGKRGPAKYAGRDRKYSHSEALKSARRIAGSRLKHEH